MKILFVCNQGKHRSRTSAELWKQKHSNDKVHHIGIFVEENPKKWFDWADRIYVMEDYQYNKLLEIDDSMRTFGKITILDIEDIYNYYNSKLIKVLIEKLSL